MGDRVLPKGSLVAKGKYWNRVKGARRWHTQKLAEQERIFRLRWIVVPDVEMEKPSDAVKLPNRRDKQTILNKHPKRVSAEAHDRILAEIAGRARLNHEEDDFLGFVKQDADLQMEVVEESDSSDEEESSSEEEESSEESEHEMD